jgi:hypothetical protein
MVRKNESLNYNLKQKKNYKDNYIKEELLRQIIKEEFNSYSDQYFILFF